MRFIFICGGIEPGRDGVGDYVRLLGGELVRRDHSVAVIALNDSGVKECREEKQTLNTISLPVLRLPQSHAWEGRVERAKGWVSEFQPDWISLQYVPFGFQPKGLPWGLGGRLNRIGAGCRWHFMLHELWLGLSAGHSVKHRIWGWAQRRIILKMMQTVQPEMVHTSNEIYRRALTRCRIACEILPLFSNIIVEPPTGWTSQILSLIENISSNRSKWLICGLFGAIHEEWYLQAGPWFRDVGQISGAKGVRLLVLGIGKVSPIEKMRFEDLAVSCAGYAVFRHLGEQTRENISDFLQTIDAGIATVEKDFLGKSGAVAAFKEHGLPVLIIRNDDRPDRDAAKRESILAVEDLLDVWPRRRRRYIDAGIENVARSMVASLS